MPLSRTTIYTQLIATTLEAGGVTYDLRAQQVVTPQDAWYFPKYPAHTKIVPVSGALVALARFCYQHERKLWEDDCYLGLWQHPATSEIYIDITTHLASYPDAIIAARAASEAGGRRIVSICNPRQGVTAYLDELGA